jgi:hypothetical protein
MSEPLGFSKSKAGPPPLKGAVGDLGHFQIGIDLSGDSDEITPLSQVH